ncbi:splicing factor 1-like [Argopecten irradians]|uniref:splicing factor 1-like n=1 Tax=Argopecten irradians TaxID=31199 RepID=UPI00371C7F75
MDSPADSYVSDPSLPAPAVSLGSQGAVPSSQHQSGSLIGQPGAELARSDAELSGTSSKPFQSLPLGRVVSQSAVTNSVGGSGVPAASGPWEGPCPAPCMALPSSLGAPPANSFGLQLAPLVSVAGSRSGPQSSFPPRHSLPGSSQSVTGPGLSVSGNPTFYSGSGSVDQSVDFHPTAFPSPGVNPACAQGSLGQPNQPVNGLGTQNPGSYGPNPYMSGSASGGSGGLPSFYEQGFQPQTQTGQFGQSWGHSQPTGPPNCPQGFGFGPYGFPPWHPWGLVPPTQQHFGGLLAPPPQEPSRSGASLAGTRKRHRTPSATKVKLKYSILPNIRSVKPFLKEEAKKLSQKL